MGSRGKDTMDQYYLFRDLFRSSHDCTSYHSFLLDLHASQPHADCYCQDYPLASHYSVFWAILLRACFLSIGLLEDYLTVRFPDILADIFQD